MKIKQAIIDQINNPQCRNRIGSVIGIGEQTVYQHMRANKSKGRLTWMDALEAISKETGVSVTDICEQVDSKDSAKVIPGSNTCKPTIC